MARQTRKPRGPKCPVCQAVMSPKDGDENGKPICWHAKNHAALLRARYRTASTRRKKR